MEERLNDVQLSALFHDIGKIVRRAGIDNEKHSRAGTNYLKQKNLLPENKYKEIYAAINYHHASELKSANLSNNSLAYIIYEADNIASGIDRVEYEDKMRGNEMMPLNSIFNRLRSEKNKTEKTFSLTEYQEESFNMPKLKENNNKLLQGDYAELLRQIENNIKEMKGNITIEKLMTVLEKCCLYFPSSAYIDYPDISYYDHVKLTAALSACMYLYDKENNIIDFKKEYYGNKEIRKKEKFLFVSGEFSGIQNFIYTITSKMAMKSLRGRSFYLEFFIEHIIDEILSALNLSRVNLIYSGGSQFYMLLPNIEKSKKVLEEYKEIINNFLIEEIGTNIYFETAYTVTSPEELGNGLSEKIKKENKIGEIFKRNSILTSKGKLSRYSKEQLEKLLDENSSLNKIYSHNKECAICKKSEKEEILEENKKEANGEIALCNSCKNYIELGKKISKIYHSNKKNKKIFIIEEKTDKKDMLILPTYPDGFVSIGTMKESNIERRLEEQRKLNKELIYRFYSVNSYYWGEGLAKNIWIGNYNISNFENKENKGEETLIEFKDLVKKTAGIERLAVLRADIDNLGSLFQSGFENKEDEPYKYVTLSKSVVLSRYLSDFFKRKINLILEKKNGAKESNEIFKKYCDVIKENNEEARDIVIVYSGGDDVFAIGTWNDIIEFSVDLRTAFKEFTNNKITISAGIGIFSENYPIYQMAEKTGKLEKKAKEYSKNNFNIPTKDAVSLFGEINKNLDHTYSWDDFIDNILYDKYLFIKSKITFNEDEKTDKIFVGKSKWYKIMNLIKDIINNNERLDIARFAYILARIKKHDKNEKNYNEFKTKIFTWIKNKKDARELLTAINIIIYEEREKGKGE